MSTLAAIAYPDLGTAERAGDELVQLTPKGRARLGMAAGASSVLGTEPSVVDHSIKLGDGSCAFRVSGT